MPYFAKKQIIATPYFTYSQVFQRLILHIPKFSNALFYIFLSFPTPYFTYFRPPSMPLSACEARSINEHIHGMRSMQH